MDFYSDLVVSAKACQVRCRRSLHLRQLVFDTAFLLQQKRRENLLPPANLHAARDGCVWETRRMSSESIVLPLLAQNENDESSHRSDFA